MKVWVVDAPLADDVGGQGDLATRGIRDDDVHGQVGLAARRTADDASGAVVPGAVPVGHLDVELQGG